MNTGLRYPGEPLCSLVLGLPRQGAPEWPILRSFHIFPAPGRRQRYPTRSSISAGDQPAGDDLRLDLGGTLENVQDARVAQDTADRIFERIAVAAMDL